MNFKVRVVLSCSFSWFEWHTRESGSMFDPRAERADTHTRGAPTDPAFSGRVMIRQPWDPAVHGS